MAEEGFCFSCLCVFSELNSAFLVGFLRKVYGILSVQLAFTTIVGALCVTVEPVKQFMQQRWDSLNIEEICIFNGSLEYCCRLIFFYFLQ